MRRRACVGWTSRWGFMRVSGQGMSVLVVGLALLGSVAMPGAQALDAGGLDLASRVAFVAVDEVHRDAGGADAEVDVFVSDVFRGGASPFRRLTETDGADAVPFVWSPDGARLLVQAAFRFDPAGSVFVVDAFGGVLGRVGEAVDSFDWSADGSRVVLGRGDRIWSVSEDGSDVREVFQVPPLEQMGETFPAERVVVDWAPAGDTVHVMAAGFGPVGVILALVVGQLGPASGDGPEWCRCRVVHGATPCWVAPNIPRGRCLSVA